jgi:hypothetical protein
MNTIDAPPESEKSSIHISHNDSLSPSRRVGGSVRIGYGHLIAEPDPFEVE